ncbi:MAG: hypothetical protein HY895_13245 [Deltaproteobacteria bacterium]|nr:hypothetical protein [Deltaproteobacteria bacterium]
MELILIIGGGTGGALAHDLTPRGFRVTLVEKGELLSGVNPARHLAELRRLLAMNGRSGPGVRSR